MAEEKTQPNQQKIQIRDNIAGGEYANNMRVGLAREEFLLVFDNIIAPTGRTVSKIIVSPGHLKRIVALLDAKVKEYEKNFGSIEEAQIPKSDTGISGFDPDRDSN